MLLEKLKRSIGYFTFLNSPAAFGSTAEHPTVIIRELTQKRPTDRQCNESGETGPIRELEQLQPSTANQMPISGLLKCIPLRDPDQERSMRNLMALAHLRPPCLLLLRAGREAR